MSNVAVVAHSRKSLGGGLPEFRSVLAAEGALTLDPILKSLVGRLRPVVAHPIAHGTGDSFPSGHSLGSIVCYGAVLLVFL
ncbi:MAG TPA: hypothetical protein VED20_08830, partial [Streptosporangiaceae bacterium]|nr:hypothetical protein [Streptosporangiaceae bacterium]